MKQVLLAVALVAATALPAAAQNSNAGTAAPPPGLTQQWLDLERRKVELAERQQKEKEAEICAERAPWGEPCQASGTSPTTKPADPASTLVPGSPSWILIVGGTAYITGSGGEPTRFPTLESCQAEAAQTLAYEAGKRGVGISQLDWPMQCLHVDAEKSVQRRFGGPNRGWQ